MTDQQKVHGASTDEGTVRKAFATYFYDPSWKKGRPDQMDHWNTWNAAWQAALAHASSATVKENLTVGEDNTYIVPTTFPGDNHAGNREHQGQQAHRMDHSDRYGGCNTQGLRNRQPGAGRSAVSDAAGKCDCSPCSAGADAWNLDALLLTDQVNAPSAEDARDQWSGVPNVVRQMRNCASDIANKKSLTGKWVHDTLSWYADEIDQALAAERGEE